MGKEPVKKYTKFCRYCEKIFQGTSRKYRVCYECRAKLSKPTIEPCPNNQHKISSKRYWTSLNPISDKGLLEFISKQNKPTAQVLREALVFYAQKCGVSK